MTPTEPTEPDVAGGDIDIDAAPDDGLPDAENATDTADVTEDESTEDDGDKEWTYTDEQRAADNEEDTATE